MANTQNESSRHGREVGKKNPLSLCGRDGQDFKGTGHSVPLVSRQHQCPEFANSRSQFLILSISRLSWRHGYCIERMLLRWIAWYNSFNIPIIPSSNSSSFRTLHNYSRGSPVPIA
ncbi:hypothetical protein SLE2022_341370 [Rubroshorea leprosula]